ncbi:MAG: hypothetical protein ACI90V_005469 [Bacillariaceae sp.]|jgi:hypothetical protein
MRPIAPVTVCCAPDLALISEISDPFAQCRLIDPPHAPAATPQKALNIFPRQIHGRKKGFGSKVAAHSRVIPMSTDISANILHLLTSVRNRDEAAYVNRRPGEEERWNREI